MPAIYLPMLCFRWIQYWENSVHQGRNKACSYSVLCSTHNLETEISELASQDAIHYARRGIRRYCKYISVRCKDGPQSPIDLYVMKLLQNGPARMVNPLFLHLDPSAHRLAIICPYFIYFPRAFRSGRINFNHLIKGMTIIQSPIKISTDFPRNISIVGLQMNKTVACEQISQSNETSDYPLSCFPERQC